MRRGPAKDVARHAHRSRMKSGHSLSAQWRASLPYQLTPRATARHGRDRRRPEPGPAHEPPAPGRRRRRQDLVAIYAMLRAVEAGRAGPPLMAPTQILAEQHALNLRRQLEPLGVRVDLFTGNTKNKKGRPPPGRRDRSVLRARRSEARGQAGRVHRHRHPRAALRPLRRGQARPRRHR